MNADEVIARFGLVPLVAEGGFVNRYWPSADDTEVAPGSAIWFLVTDAPDGCSRFHRLTIDEIWHRYLGDPAELVLLDPDGSSRRVLLGDDLAAGHELVVVVPAGTWMACRTTRDWSLLGTTMAPGFTPGCFEAGTATDLVAGWPQEAAAITALTRDGSGGAA
ncbi:MAG TPA: cupin domain-containing protein [Ilumatobacteraceae bacterium]|nr:cupin domain-containing protein [Ilumatobacteraceae bacterium]